MTLQKQDWEEYAEINLRHEFQGTLGKERTDELWKWIESLISLSISQARKEERERIIESIESYMNDIQDNRGSLPSIIKMIEALSLKEEESCSQ